MKSSTVWTQIFVERGDVETFDVKVKCYFECHRAHRGKRDSMGVPEEPDEPATIEFDYAQLDDGSQFELTPSEIECAREQLLEEMENQ